MPDGTEKKPKPTPYFAMDARKWEIAYLVAEDELTIDQIARKFELNEKTIDNWKKHPDFKAAVASIIEETVKRILSTGIARKENRVKALNDRWTRMTQLIEARATDPDMQHIPGGPTGTIVRQLKSVGFGENNQIVDEFVFDRALFAELREHEKQASQELGQWDSKDEDVRPGKVIIQWKDPDPIPPVAPAPEPDTTV